MSLAVCSALGSIILRPLEGGVLGAAHQAFGHVVHAEGVSEFMRSNGRAEHTRREPDSMLRALTGAATWAEQGRGRDSVDPSVALGPVPNDDGARFVRLRCDERRSFLDGFALLGSEGRIGVPGGVFPARGEQNKKRRGPYSHIRLTFERADSFSNADDLCGDVGSNLRGAT